MPHPAPLPGPADPQYARFKPPETVDDILRGVCGEGPDTQVFMTLADGTHRLLTPLDPHEALAWPYLDELTSDINAVVRNFFDRVGGDIKVPDGLEVTCWLGPTGMKLALAKPLPTRRFHDAPPGRPQNQ